MSLLFISLCSVPGGRTCAAALPTRAGMDRHSLFLAAGSRDGATGWASTDPLPTGQGMLQGSACSLLGTAPPQSEPHTAASFLLFRHCDGFKV